MNKLTRECLDLYLGGKYLTGGITMKIYIAGKITGNPDYKEQFAEAEKMLVAQGNEVMNPSVLPPGFEHHEYMRICYSMIDVCEGVYFLRNWRESVGAKMEYDYACQWKKKIMFAGEDGEG